MGDRSYIVVESKQFASPLVFYSHWSGEENIKAVNDVLLVTDRIGDPNYLAAQIFWCFASSAGYDGKLGFGIAPMDLYGNGELDWADVPTVYVDADKGRYSIGGDDWFDRFDNPI